MSVPGYRVHLQSVVAGTVAPYGYTLTLWTSGAVTIRAQGHLPSTVDAILLLLGAVAAFGLVGAGAYGRLGARLAPGAAGPVRVWGGMHLPAVVSAVLICSLVAHLVHGLTVWALVGALATGTYLVALAAQYWLAAARRRSSAGPVAET